MVLSVLGNIKLFRGDLKNLKFHVSLFTVNQGSNLILVNFIENFLNVLKKKKVFWIHGHLKKPIKWFMDGPKASFNCKYDFILKKNWSFFSEKRHQAEHGLIENERDVKVDLPHQRLRSGDFI